MRKMKDSGIEWIGEIPKDWEVSRIKNYLKRNEPRNPGDKIVLSLYRDLGIVPKDSRDDNHNVTSLDTSNYKYVCIGDFVINKMKAWQGSVAVSDYEGIVSPAYYVYNFTDSTFVKKYFHYLLRNCYKDEFRRLSGGIREGQWDLSSENFDTTLVIIPDKISQTAIAAYLDRQCTHIDNIIEKTKTSIEEYKKLKQAVITQAVTKGIRGNREMKDSGIDWIGEIPVEWEITPFRHVLIERNEKNIPIRTEERLSLSIDLGVTLYSEKTTNLDRFKDDFEQYKLAHEGDLVMNSMNMIVGASGVSKYYGCVSPVYYTFYDNLPDHTTAKYCEYIFRSKTMLRVLYSLGKGIYAIVRGDDRVNTCRLKVSKEDLKSLSIPNPSVDEQREIINYLDQKCSEIDAIITKKQQFITEMENYKKSLIFECVTGKREVSV